MPFTCATLLHRHPDAWDNATRHPFLDQCKAGTIQPAQFNTWLVQDYLFVVEFTRMAARLLAAAPVGDFDVLLSGLGALQAELQWFRDKASDRQLLLDTAQQPTCEEYCQVMEALADRPYAVQAVAFWAIELSYNQGWQRPGPMPAPYTEFADRWGNPGFTDYVKLLEHQADQALAAADAGEQAEAEMAFLAIATLEQAFWQMAFAAT
jgi:formylaminopyrimidine deformylase / aminopyrimidine aminohydrolase